MTIEDCSLEMLEERWFRPMPSENLPNESEESIRLKLERALEDIKRIEVIGGGGVGVQGGDGSGGGAYWRQIGHGNTYINPQFVNPANIYVPFQQVNTTPANVTWTTTATATFANPANWTTTAVWNGDTVTLNVGNEVQADIPEDFEEGNGTENA